MEESYVVYVENDVGKHHIWFDKRDDAIIMANIMLDALGTVSVYIGTIRWTSRIPYNPRYRLADGAAGPYSEAPDSRQMPATDTAPQEG